ncbi:ABC transporter substrate-binding protein [Falsiroseomonas selenitidurans]|uniref:Polyamine ABC transporter substrate-binding protein n=1 Tax=Falsiroseomonas selenitidurans TaxID=2716335 RepID=A0ABX1E4V9_9PROT|nr:ABC transporter substrate-binding protein [Falsiroseomonas selenitidurans]NKC30807.1 polyamine ABC transporter substrate-binding protein [Falsiroseomonas selenitidurans]
MRGFRAALLGSAMAIASAIGLNTTAMAQGAAGGQTLRVGMAAQDVGRLDPHFAVSTIDRVVVAWMFNGLVRFKPGSIDPALIEPDLAERWESSADGKTWTFHLRRGVQFHGGFGEMTADDVVFSLRKAGTAASSAFAADYRAIETIEAVDSHTVRIVLRNNVPSLLGILTNYSGGYIVSKKAVEQRGDNFVRAPIGTGPFALDRVTPNQSAELVAHAGYFRGAPQLGRISYRFIPSDASRDLAFQNRELDLNYGRADQTWVNRTRQVPNTVVDVFEPGELAILHLNTTAPPFNDIRIRQAMAHAVNRSELVRFRGQDVSREAQSVVPRGYLGFTAEHTLPGADPARARALLAEAGHPNGITIRVIHTQLPEMLNMMQVVQQQLRRSGITLDLQVVEHATFHQQIRQDLSPLVYYSAARFPVADIYLTQFFHGRSIVKTPTAVTNFSHCNQADEQIDQARVSTDIEAQRRLWGEAQRILVQNVCGVPLIETLLVFARRDNLDYGYALRGSMSLGPLITEATRLR